MVNHFTRWESQVILALLIGILLGGPGFGADLPSSAAAWEDDFAEVCASAEQVMTLPPEELRRLISECDRLKPYIEALPATPKKVYLRRLEMTRNLLQFTLETDKTPPPQ